MIYHWMTVFTIEENEFSIVAAIGVGPTKLQEIKTELENIILQEFESFSPTL